MAIFIRVGFTNAPYEFIEKEPFETEYGVVGLVKDAQKKYRSTYVKYNYIGTCICVLSPIPFLSAAFTDNDFFTVVMLTVTLLIAGIGAMFFIVSGVRWASMQKLLKEGEYDPVEKRKAASKKQWVQFIGLSPRQSFWVGASSQTIGTRAGSYGRLLVSYLWQL